MNWWQPALLNRLKDGPVTAEEIGKILHGYGPDAVCRVRGAGLPLVVVGTVEGRRPGFKRKLYALVPDVPRNPEDDLPGATA